MQSTPKPKRPARRPAKPEPPTNLTAARSGDRRRALEVLRDTLADRLDTAEAQIHAQLAAQYRATLSELADLPKVEEMSARDRLAERVAAANVVA